MNGLSFVPEQLQQLAAVCQFVITVLCIGALFMRMHLMSLDTLRVVRLQHGCLFVALVMSLVLPGSVAHAVLALGVLVFLAASALRWRHRPPPATSASRPMPLDAIEEAPVSGSAQC